MPLRTARYQVVFQFAVAFFADASEVSAFEERLVSYLPRTCRFEGRQNEAGTVNFLVCTNAPLAAHRAFRRMATRTMERHLRVSFRMRQGRGWAGWMNVWPFRDARPFALAYEPEYDPFKPSSKREIPKRGKPGASKRVTPARRA